MGNLNYLQLPFCSRYFCPNLGVGGAFKWVPRAVADGICQEKPLAQLENAPLPPNFRILVYGNSHMRQVSQRNIAFQFPEIGGWRPRKNANPIRERPF